MPARLFQNPIALGEKSLDPASFPVRDVAVAAGAGLVSFGFAGRDEGARVQDKSSIEDKTNRTAE